MELKERFLQLCKTVNREGFEDLLEWLERSDFYRAPASKVCHGSYPGGLLEHSLNVYDELKRLLSVYQEVNLPNRIYANNLALSRTDDIPRQYASWSRHYACS